MSSFGKELRDSIAPKFHRKWDVNPIVAIGLSTAILRLGLSDDELFTLCKKWAQGLFVTFHEDRRTKTPEQERFSEAHNLIRDRQTFNQALSDFRDDRPEGEIVTTELKRAVRGLKEQVVGLQAKEVRCIRDHGDMEKQQRQVASVFDTYLQTLALRPQWDNDLSPVAAMPLTQVRRLTVVRYNIVGGHERTEVSDNAAWAVCMEYKQLINKLKQQKRNEAEARAAEAKAAAREGTASATDTTLPDQVPITAVPAVKTQEETLHVRQRNELRKKFYEAGMHEQTLQKLQREARDIKYKLPVIRWDERIAYCKHQLNQLTTGRVFPSVSEAQLGCTDHYVAALRPAYQEHREALLNRLVRWATVVTHLLVEPSLQTVELGRITETSETVVGSIPLAALEDRAFEAYLENSVLTAPASSLLSRLSPNVMQGHVLVTLPTEKVSIARSTFASQASRLGRRVGGPVQGSYRLSGIVLDIR